MTSLKIIFKWIRAKIMKNDENSLLNIVQTLFKHSLDIHHYLQIVSVHDDFFINLFRHSSLSANELHSVNDNKLVSDSANGSSLIVHDEDDECSLEIIIVIFHDHANDQFYGLIPKISKSAKKGPFLTLFENSS